MDGGKEGGGGGERGMHNVECLSACISHCDCEECVHEYAQTVLYSRYIILIKYN